MENLWQHLRNPHKAPVRAESLSAARKLISTIIILMLIVGAALVGVVLYSARTMDRNTVTAQSELIDNSLTARLTRSLSELRSVAWWDEAVVKSAGPQMDRDWLDLEVGVFMTESFHHDRIMILDEHEQPVYGFSGEGPTDAAVMRRDLAAIQPLVQQARGGANASPRILDKELISAAMEDSGFSNRRYGRAAAALRRIGDQGELVAIMAITPSVDMKLTPARPRLLVSFITLNDAYWAQASRELMLSDLGFAKTKDKRGARLALKSDDGHMIGSLGWTPRRPGVHLINKVLPIVLLGLACAILFFSALARRLTKTTRALEAREQSAQFIANHDVLTELPNRRMLEAEMLRHAENPAHAPRQLVVACLDIDRFKDINDTLGHPAGDQLICAVSGRLRGLLGADDMIARLGGDEFAIVRPCTREDDAAQLLQLIMDGVRAPFKINGAMIETSVSVGLVLADVTRDFDDIMREVDIALYEAKGNGRGCGIHFQPEMATRIEKRRMIEVDLRYAIANRELTMMYQPIVDASSGQISAVEALVRWTSARHGPIGPDIFIPIAEDAGLMADLGRLVIEQAISDSRRWPNITTAINISAAQLRATSILEDLMEPTRRFGVSPRQITVEITESVLMGKDQHTMRILDTLKREGFTLALDDFGTGYSSLSYLRDFPFDKLKIDQSFVRDVASSERALAILQTIANFGIVLSKDVIAEGVETDVEMQIMQAAGCTHLQGYLFSRPVSADHIETMAALGRLGAARDNSKVAKRIITKKAREARR